MPKSVGMVCPGPASNTHRQHDAHFKPARRLMYLVLGVSGVSGARRLLERPSLKSKFGLCHEFAVAQQSNFATFNLGWL